MADEISTFPEVAALLGITPKKINSKENKYPCPVCGKFEVQANDLFGKCWKCDTKFNYISYYAQVSGISTKDATKDISNKVGRNAGDYFSYNEPKQEEPLADIEKRHETYSCLLSQLKISKKHIDNLHSRGLSDEQIKKLQYKSYYVGFKDEREKLTKRLSDKGCQIKGIPGFYQETDSSNGRKYLTICWRKYGILVPYKNRNNLIQGFQVRKDNDKLEKDEDGKLENKYDWFSSGDKDYGSRTRGFCHYACDFYKEFSTGKEHPFLKSDLLLTEGAMKADIIHALCKQPVLAVPGINATKELEKEFAFLLDQGVTTIIDCFDMDYLTNPNVQKASERLIKMINAAGLKYIRARWNPEYKGLDDYLAAREKAKTKN